MAYTRVAMLSERPHGIEAFGELSIYILVVASLSRDELLRQTSKIDFCRCRTLPLTRRIPFLLPQPDLTYPPGSKASTLPHPRLLRRIS